jgi:predicted metal-dependent phosphoesterase TrpH
VAAAFVDLHCHTRASFDCLSAPRAVVNAAAERGLTHLAITDHDRIDGAQEARELAPAGLTVIVGEEVKTAEGDLICLFLERAIPPGLSVAETIAAAREQGGLVGVPHPFDRLRGSLLREEAAVDVFVHEVDWIETHNARVIGRGNHHAAEYASEHGLPGVAVSDAHSILEIGVAYTRLEGDPSTAHGLREALAGVQLVPGRASLVVRAWTPVAKAVQRTRGNRRIRPRTPASDVDRGENR